MVTQEQDKLISNVAKNKETEQEKHWKQIQAIRQQQQNVQQQQIQDPRLQSEKIGKNIISNVLLRARRLEIHDNKIPLFLYLALQRLQQQQPQQAQIRQITDNTGAVFTTGSAVDNKTQLQISTSQVFIVMKIRFISTNIT